MHKQLNITTSNKRGKSFPPLLKVCREFSFAKDSEQLGWPCCNALCNVHTSTKNLPKIVEIKDQKLLKKERPVLGIHVLRRDQQSRGVCPTR